MGAKQMEMKYDGPFLDTDKGWGTARLFLQHTGLWNSVPATQGSYRNVANNHAKIYPDQYTAFKAMLRLKHGDII
jgi:hypothetical protein